MPASPSYRLSDLELVIFDLDGTLVDSRLDIAAAVNHALRRSGRETLPVATITGFVGDGVGPLLRRALPEASPEVLEAARADFDAAYGQGSATHTRPFPGIPELLARLGGLRLAVATNKAEPFVAPLLEGVGLLEHFDAVVGALPSRPRKPAPDPLLHLMRELGVRPGRTLMVGDGPQDLGAGRAAGVRICAVRWGYGRDEEIAPFEPDLVVGRAEELGSALGVGR